MSVICNVHVDSTDEKWSAIYAPNEVGIEAAAAYFARAFCEALGMVADLELHDIRRAELRLQSVAILLSEALHEYSEVARIDRETGLGEHHRNLVLDAAAKAGGLGGVLQEARTQGFINLTDEQITELSAATRQTYADAMGVYLEEVGSIADLVNLAPPREDAIAWQELAWRLCSAFSRAMALGQAIAVLNIYTFRVAPVAQS